MKLHTGIDEHYVKSYPTVRACFRGLFKNCKAESDIVDLERQLEAAYKYLSVEPEIAEAEITRLDELIAKIIYERATQVLDAIKQQHDLAVKEAKRLLSSVVKS